MKNPPVCWARKPRPACVEKYSSPRSFTAPARVAGLLYFGSIVASVALVLQATAAVALAAAGLVLAGALAAARRRRLYEAVVLKVLGATRANLLASFLWEYGLLGLLAAAIASALGTVASYLVLTRVMRTDWVFLPETAVISAGVALILTLTLGYAGTWRALGVSAAPYLRNE